MPRQAMRERSLKMSKISNSLVAYASIAHRAEKYSDIYAAFQPFFIHVFQKNGVSAIDPTATSKSLFDEYGMHIPELAVEGLLGGMLGRGFIKKEGVGEKAIYYFDDTSSISEEVNQTHYAENEIRSLFREIEEYVVKRLRSAGYDPEKVNIAEKIRTAIVRPGIFLNIGEKPDDERLSADDAAEYFCIENMALYQTEKPESFDLLSGIAAGGMAVNFLEAFVIPQKPAAHRSVTLFFDTTVLLNALDFGDRRNGEHIRQLMSDAEKLGVNFAVMSEIVDETHAILYAILQSLASGRPVWRATGTRIKSDESVRNLVINFVASPVPFLKRRNIRHFNIKTDYPHIIKNFTLRDEENIIPEIRRMRDVKARAVDAALIANVEDF